MLSDKKECTIKEFCEYYGVTSVTVERWRKNKNMPFIKRGRNIFFVVADIEKWMAENYKIVKVNYDDKEENPVN